MAKLVLKPGALRQIGKLAGMQNAVDKVADEAVSEARGMSPVDTGEFRSSWIRSRGDRTDRASAKVENTSDHAAAVEFGNEANGYDAQRILGRLIDRVGRG